MLVGTVGIELNRNLLFGSHKFSSHICWLSSELTKARVPPEFQLCDMGGSSVDWRTSVLSLLAFSWFYMELCNAHVLQSHAMKCSLSFCPVDLCVCCMKVVRKLLPGANAIYAFCFA